MTDHALLDLFIIAVPIALAWLWWSGAKAYELAVGHARTACHHRQLQFLDQTAALSSMRISRNEQGMTCLTRVYLFEFTDYGDFRDEATVTMQGASLKGVNFPYTRDEGGHRIYLH